MHVFFCNCFIWVNFKCSRQKRKWPTLNVNFPQRNSWADKSMSNALAQWKKWSGNFEMFELGLKKSQKSIFNLICPGNRTPQKPRIYPGNRDRHLPHRVTIIFRLDQTKAWSLYRISENIRNIQNIKTNWLL